MYPMKPNPAHPITDDAEDDPLDSTTEEELLELLVDNNFGDAAFVVVFEDPDFSPLDSGVPAPRTLH